MVQDNIKKFKKNPIKEAKNEDIPGLKPKSKKELESKEVEGNKSTIYERFQEKHAIKLFEASQLRMLRE